MPSQHKNNRKIARLTPFLLVVLIAVCLAILFASLFPQQSGAMVGMFASVVREDVIGDLFPLGEKRISQSILESPRIVVNSVCKRQYLFTYSVYVDIEHLNGPIGTTRHFIAEKDAIQDCNEFIVDSVKMQNDGALLKVDFRNGSHRRLTITN